MTREPLRLRLLGGLIRLFERADSTLGLTPSPHRPNRAPGELGPWYQPGPIHRIACSGPWLPHPLEQAGAAPRCPSCGTGEDLALLWLPDAAHLARFQCPTPGCRTAWIDPAWARSDVTLLLQAAHLEGSEPDTVTWRMPQRDADPDLSALAERMRYEAGTDRRDRREEGEL